MHFHEKMGRIMPVIWASNASFPPKGWFEHSKKFITIKTNETTAVEAPLFDL